MMTNYIIKVFQNKEETEIYGLKACKPALMTQILKKNWQELYSIYSDLSGKKID